jgi:hypothetical protein
MKYLLLIFFLLFCLGCTRQNSTQALVHELDYVSNADLLAIVVPEHSPVLEETLEEIRRQFEGMTILDMISFIINNKRYINVGSDDASYSIHIGYFEFLSRESIQWYHDSSGYRFFPNLYIIDENNLRVEVFSFLGRSVEIRMGRHCSVRKYYIDISTEQLIDYYLRIKRQIDTYIVTDFFFVNITEEQEKERNGYFFKVLRDTTVHEDRAKQGTLIGMIHTGNMVKVIDMHYQNFSDRYPVSIRIETESLNGWVNVDSIDFIHFVD